MMVSNAETPVGLRVDTWDEEAKRQGYVYSEAKAVKAQTFLEKFCRQSKGRAWAGKPLVLLPWQVSYIHRLYGWIHKETGLRRYTSSHGEVAKKNGKSTMSSGMALNGLVADGEPGPEVYTCAVDRKQAGIVYGEAEKMALASPALKKILKPIPSVKRINYPKENGALVACSADAYSQDGLNASLVIFDEVHRQRNRLLWDVMRYASVSRDQPLLISWTTAGEQESGLWHEQREYAEAVNAGTIEDIHHLGIIYRAEESDDLESPDTWRKANPSLGLILDEARFKADFEKARERPTEFDNFLRLRLNIVAKGEKKFVDSLKWKACQGETEVPDGSPCFVGVDISSRIDLASITAIFPIGQKIIVRSWSFCPTETAKSKDRAEGTNYLAWAKNKYLTLIPGERIDYDYLYSLMQELGSRFKIKAVGADPWNAAEFMGNLKDKSGLDVIEVRQTLIVVNEPTKELEALIAERRIEHDGNPLLSWAMSNCVTRLNSTGLVGLDKGKSSGKIDPVVALVNALASKLYKASQPEETESVYKTRGLRSI
jgi:phage terminase large subunit-like protein